MANASVDGGSAGSRVPASITSGPSAWRTQPGKRDSDEAAGRGLRRQASGRREGVEAVARELVGSDVVPDVAGPCALGEQIPEKGVELLLRPGDVFAPVQGPRVRWRRARGRSEG